MARRAKNQRETDVPPYDERVGPTAFQDRKNGPAMAAVLASGFGTFVLGLITTLAEVSHSLKDSLNLYDPVGPLSGKTLIAVAAFAFVWIVLGVAWRKRDVDVRLIVVITAVLIGLGFIGTYPTFFERFAAE